MGGGLEALAFGVLPQNVSTFSIKPASTNTRSFNVRCSPCERCRVGKFSACIVSVLTASCVLVTFSLYSSLEHIVKATCRAPWS